MTYELMVLVAPSVDMTEEKAQKDFVTSLVGSDVTVKEVTSLGKKMLAYDIAKQKEATYLVAALEGIVKSAEVDKKAKLNDSVLRFLLTAKE